MAGETLRTAAQLLSEFPDNTAGLIDAIASRNLITSSGIDAAFVEEEFGLAGVPLPMTDVVSDTVVTDLWSTPTEAFRFWQRAGGQVSPAYVDAGVIVPAGVSRIASFRYDLLCTRQPPVAPLQFGGTYQVQWGDGDAAAGQINYHSNLTQVQIADLDDNGVDLSASWQSLGIRDYINVGGIFYKLVTDAVPGVASTTLEWGDPLQRPDVQGGADPFSFVQGSARDDDFYEFGIFQNGNQITTNVRAISDLGTALTISDALIQEISLDDQYDLRVGKAVATAPDIDVHVLDLTVFGVLI